MAKRVCNKEKKVYFCTLKFKNDSVAQPVEHMPFKHRVLGSNPSGITKTGRRENEDLFLLLYPHQYIEAISIL